MARVALAARPSSRAPGTPTSHAGNMGSNPLVAATYSNLVATSEVPDRRENLNINDSLLQYRIDCHTVYGTFDEMS